MPKPLKPFGSPKSKIAFICDAPSSQELTQGHFFVGASGKKLDELLASVGLTRQDVYITSVLKEQPPKGGMGTYVGWDNGPVVQGGFEAHLNALYEELRGLEANVLVPLGNVALWALTGQWGIVKRRGSIYWMNGEGGEGKVVPTLHPDECQPNRNPLNIYPVTSDFLRIVEESKTAKMTLPKRTLHLDLSYKDAVDYVRECRGLERVGFDIESSTIRDGSERYTREMLMFSLAKSSEDACCISLVREDGSPLYAAKRETQLLVELGKLLEDREVEKWGQNLMYDASVMYHRYGMQVWPIQDSMIAHSVLYPDLPKDLGFLTSLYSREPYFKEAGAKFFTGKESDWDGFKRYSALDSAILCDIVPPLLRDLHKQGNYKHYRDHVEAIQPLLHFQEQGLLVDKGALAGLKRTVNKEIKAKQRELDAVWCAVKRERDPSWEPAVEALKVSIATGLQKGRGVKGKREALGKLLSLNVKSTKQKIEFFYGKDGQNFQKPKREPTDKRAIKRLVAKGAKGAELLAEITQLRDDVAKYYSVKLDHDSRIRGSYNPVGGQARFSSSKTLFGTGCNMQNQPSRMKKHMLADPEHFLINLDLAQAENRVVAVLARDEKMKRAFEDGTDVHSLTAALIFNKPIEEVSSEKGSSTLGDGKHSERDWGKRANHALNYGMGIRLLSEQYEIPYNDAKFLYEAYHAAYPGVSKYFWGDVERELRENQRTLTNLLGRKRTYLGLWSPKLLKEAYSYKPQSLIPGILNPYGLVEAWNNPAFNLLQPVNQVHDSLVFQAPVAQAPEALNQIRELVKKVEIPLEFEGYRFTIPADVEVGLNCTDMVSLGVVECLGN